MEGWGGGWRVGVEVEGWGRGWGVGVEGGGLGSRVAVRGGVQCYQSLSCLRSIDDRC